MYFQLNYTASVDPEVPKITVPQQVILSSVGADATLECKATGIPPPLVRWYKSKLRPNTLTKWNSLFFFALSGGQKSYLVCIFRCTWGWVRSFCRTGCTPRDLAYSSCAGGRRRSVQLCGKQLCWNLVWYCQPSGWRWDLCVPHEGFFFFSLHKGKTHLLPFILAQRALCSRRNRLMLQPMWGRISPFHVLPGVSHSQQWPGTDRTAGRFCLGQTVTAGPHKRRMDI